MFQNQVDESDFTGELYASKSAECLNSCNDAAYPANMLLRSSTVIDGETGVQALLEKIKELLVSCGYGNGVTEMDEKDFPALVKGINSDAVNYSPAMILTDEEIESLLVQIKGGIAG